MEPTPQIVSVNGTAARPVSISIPGVLHQPSGNSGGASFFRGESISFEKLPLIAPGMVGILTIGSPTGSGAPSVSISIPGSHFSPGQPIIVPGSSTAMMGQGLYAWDFFIVPEDGLSSESNLADR